MLVHHANMLLPNTTAAVCLRPQVCHTYKRNYQFTTNGHIWNPINLTLIKKELITKPEADQFMRATIHGNMQASNGYWSHHPAARWVTTKVHPHVGCTRHRKKTFLSGNCFASGERESSFSSIVLVVLMKLPHITGRSYQRPQSSSPATPGQVISSLGI